MKEKNPGRLWQESLRSRVGALGLRLGGEVSRDEVTRRGLDLAQMALDEGKGVVVLIDHRKGLEAKKGCLPPVDIGRVDAVVEGWALLACLKADRYLAPVGAYLWQKKMLRWGLMALGGCLPGVELMPVIRARDRELGVVEIGSGQWVGGYGRKEEGTAQKVNQVYLQRAEELLAMGRSVVMLAPAARRLSAEESISLARGVVELMVKPGVVTGCMSSRFIPGQYVRQKVVVSDRWWEFGRERVDMKRFREWANMVVNEEMERLRELG